MLGSYGLWASSKGMKVVGNYTTLAKAAAEAQVVSDGFIVGTETNQNLTNAEDQLKHNTVVAQSPASGELKNYESPVDLTIGLFSFTAFGVFGFFNVFDFFSVFNFFSVFDFFSVFGFFGVFSFFSVFDFFSVFGFFGVFNFFSVFTFAPFGFFHVFTFTPTFGFFSVFTFTPAFSVFSFR